MDGGESLQNCQQFRKTAFDVADIAADTDERFVSPLFASIVILFGELSRGESVQRWSYLFGEIHGVSLMRFVALALLASL